MTPVTIPTLSGYKTYLAAAVAVAFAGLSYYEGTMTLNAAVAFVLSSSAVASLRAGLKTTVEAAVTKLMPAIVASGQPPVMLSLGTSGAPMLVTAPAQAFPPAILANQGSAGLAATAPLGTSTLLPRAPAPIPMPAGAVPPVSSFTPYPPKVPS